jgi:mRNA-degrading endonuclease RelE of RelBE toxin-antitoxin system
MNTSLPWEVRLAGPARKSLERIEAPELDRIQAVLREMLQEPFQGDIKLLRAPGRVFRRRVGSWRIFFYRIPNERIIVITAIERRSSTTY